jgi:hypothetical protein
MTEWLAVGVAAEGEPIAVDGENLWQHTWHRIDVPQVYLPHPAYRHQLHAFDVHEISIDRRKVRFAVAELSAGVWGFYVLAANST